MKNLEIARVIFKEAKVLDSIREEVTEEEYTREDVHFCLDTFDEIEAVLTLDYSADYEVYEDDGDYENPPHYELTVFDVLIENVALYIDGDSVLTAEESAQLDKEFSKQ